MDPNFSSLDIGHLSSWYYFIIANQKEIKVSENPVSLHIAILCLCLYKHTCPCICGFLYSWGTNSIYAYKVSPLVLKYPYG